MTTSPELDADRVRTLLGRQFPDLDPTAVAYLGEGYDSTVFEVDARWVFRFPKRADVERQLLLEMRVLPVLAQQAPLPVPAFRFHGRPSGLFPRHFGGYTKLEGVPALGLEPGAAVRVGWAPVLAGFFSWLHSFPVDEAVGLGVPVQDAASLIAEARTEALHDLAALNPVIPGTTLDQWGAWLAEAPPAPATPSTAVLVHGDFAAEHVLHEAGTQAITGLIDWSDMVVGDAALDLAGLFHWGGDDLADAVLSGYSGRVDGLLVDRARYLAACRGVADIVFGLEMDRPEYIDAGHRALALTIGSSEHPI